MLNGIVPRLGAHCKHMENYSGAYIITRQRKGGGRGRPPKRRGHGAAALIVLLMLLTAGIVFLAVILPRLPSGSEKASSPKAFGGRTFYLLAVGDAEDYTQAAIMANNAESRGGGGFIYNDGKYRIIAAAYAHEAEAKALAEVNDGAYCIVLNIPETSNENDARVVNYICGEFYTRLNDTANALDRGTVTDAAADYIVYCATLRLNELMDGVTPALSFALEDCLDYAAGGGGRTQLSYIRRATVKALVGAYNGLSAH